MGPSSTRFPLTQTYKEVAKTFVTNCPRGRHSRLLTTVDDSFTGKEAVNFFLEAFPVNPFGEQEMTREKATKLLELFLKENYFYRVGARRGEIRSFKDNSTLYCFTTVEEEAEPIRDKQEMEVGPIFHDSEPYYSDDSHSVESKNEQSSCSISYKTDPIPLLNKVDLWNAYKAGFEYRLQELIPYQNLIVNWKIKGQDIQKNCELEQNLSAPFAENVMALMSYLMKLPFSKRNSNAMAAFNCLCDGITLEPVFLTEDESTSILMISEDLSYSRLYSRKEAEKTFVAIVRLFLLTIPPTRRWKLLNLFRVMNKIALDDYSGNSMQMVLEYLANVVVPCDRISSNQAIFIVQTLLCNFDEVFSVDRELLDVVERAKSNIFQSKEMDYSEISRQMSVASPSYSSSPEPSSIVFSTPEPSSIAPSSLEEIGAIPKRETGKESYQSIYDMLAELNQAKEEMPRRHGSKQEGQKVRRLLSRVFMDKTNTRY